jgi:hypothetical protein
MSIPKYCKHCKEQGKDRNGFKLYKCSISPATYRLTVDYCYRGELCKWPEYYEFKDDFFKEK